MEGIEGSPLNTPSATRKWGPGPHAQHQPILVSSCCGSRHMLKATDTTLPSLEKIIMQALSKIQASYLDTAL